MRRSHFLPRILLSAAILLAVAGMVLWGWTAWQRVGHPFALEWQEGGMWSHARRVQAGLPLYTEPSLAHTAFPYPPLFSWLGALALSLFGDSLRSLRLVSLLGTALLCLALARTVVRPGGANVRACLVALGLVMGGQVWAGDWLDVARIDALCMGLTAGCFAAQVGPPSLVRGVLAGILGAGACLTKQSALLPVACVFAAQLLRQRRTPRAALAGITTCVLVLGATWAWLAQESGPWLSFFLFELLGGHPWHPPGISGFWLRDLPRLLPIVAVAALAPGVVQELRRDGAWAWVAGLIGMAWAGRSHIGGYDNVLLPALVAAATVGGLGVHGIVAAGPERCRALAGVGLLTQGLVFLAMGGWYSLPDPGDEQRGAEFVQRLEAVPGGVLVLAHPELAYLAGKTDSLHWMALLDLSASGEGEWGRRLVAELEEGLAAGRWEVVVLDDFGDGLDSMAPALGLFGRHLRLVERPPGGFLGVPATGIQARPAEWWIQMP